MSRKSSVYFGPPRMALVANLAEGDSCSGRLNRTAERYLAIMLRHGIDLSADERLILGNCLSGSWVDPLLIHYLADEVAASEWAGRPAAMRLIKKLRSAGFADVVATVEKLGY